MRKEIGNTLFYFLSSFLRDYVKVGAFAGRFVSFLLVVSLLFSPLASSISYAQESASTTDTLEEEVLLVQPEEGVTGGDAVISEGVSENPSDADAEQSDDSIAEETQQATSTEPVEEIIVENSTTTISSEDNQEQGLDPPSEQSSDEPIIETATASTSEAEIIEESVVSEPEVKAEEVVNEPREKTKFKKDSNLPQEAQLGAVRQHLIDQELPQNIIDRLDAYAALHAQGPEREGLIKRTW